MRVFTDTNFLLSAFASRGLSAELFEQLLKRADVIYSQQVKNELFDKLIHKFKFPSEYLVEIGLLLESLTEVADSKKVIHTLRDTDDEYILASAVAANCEFLITGDKDLLSVHNEVKEIKIVSPRAMWLILKT